MDSNSIYSTKKEVITQSQNPKWTENYLDYISLLNFIHTMGKTQSSPEARKLLSTQLLSKKLHSKSFARLRSNSTHERSNNTLSSSLKSTGNLKKDVNALTRRSRLMTLSGCELEHVEIHKRPSLLALSSNPSAEMELPIEYKSSQEEFCTKLDTEIEKIGLFLLEQQGHLSTSLKLHNTNCISNMTDAAELQQIILHYIAIGVQLLDLYLYIGVNVTLIEYVLSYHDEVARKRAKTPLLLHQYYMISRCDEDQYKNSFLPILFKSNTSLQALTYTYIQGLEELEPSLVKQSLIIKDINCVIKVIDKLQHHSISNYLMDGSLGNNLYYERESIYHPDHLHIRYFAKLRMRLENGSYYSIHGSYQNVLSAGVDVAEDTMSDLPDILANDRWPFALHLNLIATLLYMTNYSVASPTSVRYVSALGGNDAFAAMLIGATPWAVLISTLIFSIITNYSFKIPMIIAVMFLCVGNFLYAVALYYKSLGMVLLGRVFIGLSSLRVINRRYIADTAPLHQRTQISAAFVTYSAIGTALGPLLAALFQHCHISITIPSSLSFIMNTNASNTIVLNGLTAPGYFCLIIWIMFFIIVLFFFSEPIRVGLHQQKSEREIDVEQYEHSKEEVQSLLHPSIKKKESCNLPNITWPVALCLILLFINKLSIECLVSSSPIITEHRYNWSVHNIAALAFIIGILVIPLSIAIGYLSRTFHDGQLLVWLFYFTLFGLFLLVDFSQLIHGKDVIQENDDIVPFLHHFDFHVNQHQYIYGCIFSFVGLQAMESLIMSTLSKVVPYELAVGTCNSGLLNTEIGTLGRAIGDLMVTFIGLYFDDVFLLDCIIIPLIVAVISSLVLVTLNYDIFSI